MKKIIAGALLALLALAPASAQSPSTTGTNYTPVNCSGTITAGGTAQNALAASTVRRGFVIKNEDTTEVLWFSFTGVAAAGASGSYSLEPGTATTYAGAGSFLSPVGFNTALSVVAATTAHKFSCSAW